MLTRRFFTRTLLSALGATAFLSRLAAAATQSFDFSPQQAGRPRADRDARAIADIPKGFRFVKEGFLTVAITPFAAPIATYATDAQTVVGSDPDYALLVADALGLKLDLLPIAWADWPLGLSSGKYDAVISNVGVTEQRKEKFDFTTYRLGLHGFYVKTDSPIKAIKEPRDVAGLRIITGSGTIQERILLEWNRQNLAKGLKALELQYYDDEAAANLALQTGRADAQFNPNAPQAFQAAKDGKTRQVGTVNAGWPLKADVAIASRKGSGLAQALATATQGLIASGRYQQSLARWSLQAEAVERSEVNPPGLPKF
ncbi:MAG: ABC transporter substrate-binding protein [Curvibacter sp.]|nr:ABC transporter substrate-binding protein [Curvibacter sp.]